MNLEANTAYTVYTRVAETETVKASAAVSIEVTTDRIEGIITLIKAEHIIYDGEAVEIGEGEDLNYTYYCGAERYFLCSDHIRRAKYL